MAMTFVPSYRKVMEKIAAMWTERKCGITVKVPPVKKQKEHDYDITGRWKVERTFAWINAFRGLAVNSNVNPRGIDLAREEPA